MATANLEVVVYDSLGQAREVQVIEPDAEVGPFGEWFAEWCRTQEDERPWVVETYRAELRDEAGTLTDEVRYDPAGLVAARRDELAAARDRLDQAERAQQEAVQYALGAGWMRAIAVAEILGVTRARVYQLRDGTR